MSSSPQALGGNSPARVVLCLSGPCSAPLYGCRPMKLACSEEADVPNEKGVDVPARQAYSHSASLGRRYTRPASFSAGSSDSLAQKATASFQLTCSIGWSGLSGKRGSHSPVRSLYCFW